MIRRDKNGRVQTVRTYEEESDIINNAIANLLPDELKLLEDCLSDGNDDRVNLLDILGEHRYGEMPVPMDQFIDDSYYLGRSCQTLYPRLKNDLCELFEPGACYREVILTGSIGWGKTMFASLALARMLYELSCLINPQITFGLSPGSEMAFILVSKNLVLARQVLKSAVDDKLKISPYFQNMFIKHMGRESTQFEANIQMNIASYGSDRILGINVFGGAMDESNFATSNSEVTTVATGQKRTVSNYDHAERVYTSLVRRIKSRFQRAGGDIPGMMILLSSATTVGSFLDRRMIEYKNDPTVFIRDYATWDVKPAGTFSGETFRVLCGGSSLRSRVLEPGEQISERELKENDSRVIDVPEEYRVDFEKDLENAIRDVAGISTTAISAFIQRPERVDECIIDVPHPFSSISWRYGDVGYFIWDRFTVRKQRRLPGGFMEEYWVPKRSPNKMRYVHIDTSLSGDCTGIAMGFIDRWVEVVRLAPDGTHFTDVAPYFVIDFMLQVHPPLGEQIYLPEIRRLVYELMEHGFKLIGFSCDQYQSAEMLQQMKRRGVASDVLSVDRTEEPYNALRSAIYERRIEYYDYRPFIKEIKSLEHDRLHGKIDHPLAGSKDIADSVAGVVHGLMQKIPRMPIGMLKEDEGKEIVDNSWVMKKNLIQDGSQQNVQQGSNVGGRVPLPFIMGD